MTTPSVTVVELTDDEMRLVNHALHSFLNAFGHEQADIVRAVEKLLTKLTNPSAQPLAASE